MNFCNSKRVIDARKLNYLSTNFKYNDFNTCAGPELSSSSNFDPKAVRVGYNLVVEIKE